MFVEHVLIQILYLIHIQKRCV